MFFNAKNGKLPIDGTCMDYVSFGKGDKALIMLPGLGDAFKTVKGTAVPFALSYQIFANDYKVYMFSRKRELPEHYPSREMAKDLKAAMDQLGIEKADVLGVSQGGTVAQYLAIDYPEAVHKLVLAVTYARQNETIGNVIGKWIEYAENRDSRSLLIDTAEKSYSERYLPKMRKQSEMAAKRWKPKSYQRFLTMAEACLTHDAYELLDKIACPTLIVGGREDKIVTCAASEELAAKIKDSKLFLYDGLGHGAYEEAADFNQRVLQFLNPAKWIYKQ